MEYRYLGASGLQVSALSYGAWITFTDQMNQDAAYEAMEAAYEAGVNFFDNAEAYGHGQAETVMGDIIKKAGWKRSDLVLSTKIFWGGTKPNDKGLSRKHVIEGTAASLARLQTDYVDVLFCHRPDRHTPIEETVRAMSYLIDQGQALYCGTSEWSAQQIMEAYSIARREHLVPPQVEQPEYNMFRRERVEREYERLYSEIGIGTTVFSPLAGGLLTGKYNEAVPENTRASIESYTWLLEERFFSEQAERRIEKVRRLTPLAEELGCSMPQLALAWCLKNENVSTVITGASKPHHLRENMKALDVVGKLTEDVMARIEEILDNKPPAEHEYRGEH